ncbi:MAG: hypothetical protein FWF84_05200 [Kiritimatiellaeota bacterium]|nr:hypothetical protein [Kiritimatiellota bacterium]
MRYVWAIVLWAGIVCQSMAQDGMSSQDKMDVIRKAGIFQEVPPPPQPPKVIEDDAPPEPPPGPPLELSVTLIALTQYGGLPAAGFTDATTGKSYYLLVGQTAGEYTILDIDMGAGTALLQKGMQVETLTLRNPMADQMASMLAGGTGAAGATPPPMSPPVSPTVRGGGTYSERQQQRVAEARRSAEEQRLQREASQQQERDKQIGELAEELARQELARRTTREENLNRVRRGLPPTMPLELTPEEYKQLESEGVFDNAPPPLSQ